LAGRLSILDKIKEVVMNIAESDEPKPMLMEKYGLDEVQATDVLDMRLRQLARLEKTKLLDEQKKLTAEEARLSGLLAKDSALRKQVIKELDADIAKFGDDRRSELLPDEKTNSRQLLQESSVSERLAPEPVAIALTERGWISWRPAKSEEELPELDFKLKTGDAVRYAWFGDRADLLLLMDETGRGYSLELTSLSKTDTVPLTTFFDYKAPIVEGVLSANGMKYIVCGEKAKGFIVSKDDWSSRMKAGKELLRLDDREKPLPPLPLLNTTAETRVATLTADGRTVVFKLSDVKELSKGLGVGFMGVANSTLADICLVEPGQPLQFESSKGKKVTVSADVWSSVDGSRTAGKKGKKLTKDGCKFIKNTIKND
ncbi:MAG TPA: hypothetical protein P5264_12805, partial [Mangrovimonas sp.]|nr:hypothetical protein [Mangrovimonas sp.]